MKKMLMMTAITAMVLGAQASYTWTVKIEDVTATAAADLEKNMQTLSATLVYKGVDPQITVTTVAGSSASTWTDSGDGKTRTYNVPSGQTFTRYLRADGKYDYTYNLNTFTMPEDNDSGDKYAKSDDFYTLLQVYSESQKKTLSFELKANPDTGSGKTFATYASYGSLPVPEPTSGMLVFLGLAGLMLKRKRAA